MRLDVLCKVEKVEVRLRDQQGSGHERFSRLLCHSPEERGKSQNKFRQGSSPKRSGFQKDHSGCNVEDGRLEDSTEGKKTSWEVVTAIQERARVATKVWRASGKFEK